jgi:hypothetical protein
MSCFFGPGTVTHQSIESFLEKCNLVSGGDLNPLLDHRIHLWRYSRRRRRVAWNLSPSVIQGLPHSGQSALGHERDAPQIYFRLFAIKIPTSPHWKLLKRSGWAASMCFWCARICTWSSEAAGEMGQQSLFFALALSLSLSLSRFAG